MEISKNFFKISHFTPRKKLTLIDMRYHERFAIPQSPFLAALLYDQFQRGNWVDLTIEDDLIIAVKLIPHEDQKRLDLKSLSLRGGTVAPHLLSKEDQEALQTLDSKGEKDDE